MAKLKAPLLSLGASGAIGKSLVFFGWKGLDVVREYVVPANPKTQPQLDQRALLTAAVAMVHAAQVASPNPMDAVDVAAYALLGSTRATPRTWFNECVKGYIDASLLALHPDLFRNGTIVEVSQELDIEVTSHISEATTGDFWYGTSKTALINSIVGALVGATWGADIVGLAGKTKYYIQFRPTAPATSVGVNSGIYYGTTLA